MEFEKSPKNLQIFIRYLNPGKTEIFLEKSWKNHGIRFRNSAGNPDSRPLTCKDT